ncbi:protein of unknown function [Lishizhenia tianjinensis]|uniref:DUF4296 domain-containing protein n=1 Tax=Lishizhenia tianjinensis TaxID=477690 RepID=A0A1I7A091_9FLAO|nr:DUF4296 domain-containing protein [Lishizhenia tianjinensis]SFT68343.1 protein of unknown function [Lishizhenia tianjinensis]
MKKLGLFLIGFSFIFTACQNNLEENPRPYDLIPQDTFQYVLQDLLVLEGYVQNKYRSLPNYYKILKREGQDIFAKYNLDSARFNTSFTYYSREQEVLNDIYTKISDSLNMRSFSIENNTTQKEDTLVTTK